MSIEKRLSQAQLRTDALTDETPGFDLTRLSEADRQAFIAMYRIARVKPVKREIDYDLLRGDLEALCRGEIR